MKVTTVNMAYFSPTFSTKTVTELVAHEMAAVGQMAPGACVDLADREIVENTYSFGPEDVLCVGVPSFGGRVPGTAAERIGSLQGDGTAAVIIAVYGNRDYEDTLLELKDLLIERGFVVVAAIASVAQHSIVPEVGAGRPDEKDCTELREAARAICEKLNDLAVLENGEVEVKGNLPYKEYGGSAMKPAADKNCTGCGACAASCPVGAIPADAPDTTDKDVCISCMRCIKVCPAGARGLNPIAKMAVEQKLKMICKERRENELYI